jgi:hypothetical protein
MIVALAAAGCGSGNTKANDSTRQQTSTSAGDRTTTLRAAVRSALAGNYTLSVYVLGNNRIPVWATRSTRGPALTALRVAAAQRRARGIRVRVLSDRRTIASIRVDPSHARAIAIVVDRQRVQPQHRNGTPLGSATRLNERARYELRRLRGTDRFVVWRVGPAR